MRIIQGTQIDFLGKMQSFLVLQQVVRILTTEFKQLKFFFCRIFKGYVFILLLLYFGHVKHALQQQLSNCSMPVVFVNHMSEILLGSCTTPTGKTGIYRTFRTYHSPKCLRVWSDSKMKTLLFFETSVAINQSTRFNIHEDLNLYQYRCENLNSRNHIDLVTQR